MRNLRLSTDEGLTFLERPVRTSRGWDWPDYPMSEEFTMPYWTDRVGRGQDHTWMSVMIGSTEVARVMVEPRTVFGRLYSVDTDRPIMELVFLEVATSWRRQKVGTLLLAKLGKRYPHHVLAAVSEDTESDGFWDAVRWSRHEHSIFPASRRVYIAPDD